MVDAICDARLDEVPRTGSGVNLDIPQGFLDAVIMHYGIGVTTVFNGAVWFDRS